MDSLMKIKYLFFLILIPPSLTATNAAKLDVPEGFKISNFVSNVEAPRQIAEGIEGYIFVGSKKGKVYALKDNDKNGVIDDVKIIISGLGDSSGVAYKDNTLYIAEISKIWKIDNIEKKLNSFSGAPLDKVLVTDQLPSDQWHGRKWIMIDDDDSILLNIGAPCNICIKEDERYATIIRYKDNDWTIEARGVRNSVGFDWNPQNNKLYFTDNGRDWLGDSIPSCELNMLEETGNFFGFPYMHSKDIVDPEFGSIGHGYEIIKPILELGAHVAPTGIEFYTSDVFPEEFLNNAFITLHGSWNSSKKVGYKVIRIVFDEFGYPISIGDFVTGFLDGEKVLGRPAAPFQMSDGSLLISDDHSNKIYRVFYEG